MCLTEHTTTDATIKDPKVEQELEFRGFNLLFHMEMEDFDKHLKHLFANTNSNAHQVLEDGNLQNQTTELYQLPGGFGEYDPRHLVFYVEFMEL